MGRLYNNLTLKIGAIIIVAEIVVLAAVGFVYVNRFSDEVDRRIEAQVQIPGTLMNAGLLNLDAVANRETMERLVGEGILEALIIGANDNVFFSLNPEHLGKRVTQMPGFDPELIGSDDVHPQTVHGEGNVASVSPIFAVDGRTPQFYVYVRVSTREADREKAQLNRLFVLGSAATVIFTSVIIILSFHSVILTRIAGVLDVLRRVEAGDLKARTRGAKSPDEIGDLQRGVNSMAERVDTLVSSLERRTHELEAEVVERRRTEMERKNLIKELEARNVELERFVYTVSHDLKTPLVTIRGFLGFLEQAAVAGNIERVKTDMARITNATNRMDQLLGELLDLSRIGRLMNPPEEVSLNELVQQAIETVRGRLEQRSVELKIAPNLPPVYGDRARLVEVLQNLVDNAVKFMGDQPEPRIEVGVRRDGEESVFYVRDNGIGIDPRYHEKVFGLFEKLDPQVEGTGVGLAIVKRIVEVHGGRVWVESEGAGQGSTFCFTLAEKNQ